MKPNGKIITGLTPILLTLSSPTLSLPKIPILPRDSEKFQLSDVILSQNNRDNVEKLKNMTYIFPDWEPPERATLRNGSYRRGPDGRGGIFSLGLREPYILFSDLNKDGVEEAIVLLDLSGGGSGCFTYLAIVNQLNSTPNHLDSVSIGDRIEIKSLQVIDGTIKINLITQGPDDPMCCPTLNTTWYYQLQNNKIVQISGSR